MKKLILFDLDNTLFDSRSFRKSVFDKIGNFYSKETTALKIAHICEEIYNEFIIEFGLFYPEMFSERLSKRIGKKVERNDISKLIFDKRTFKDHFHEDVWSTLRTVSKIGEIGIFSQGDTRFQHAKLAHLDQLISKGRIHITTNKRSKMIEVLQKYNTYKIFYVDDMLPYLYEAKKLMPNIRTVWIKRGRYAQNQKDIPDFKPDATITNLKEVIKMVAA